MPCALPHAGASAAGRKKPALHAQRMKRFVAVAESLGFAVVWSRPGWEADDMIGSLATALVRQQTAQQLATVV